MPDIDQLQQRGASAAALRLRATIIRLIRDFFAGKHYLEVETPLRLPAVAPEAHIDPLPSEGWFLQTSPELCMKRLLARGHERIFQICKCFRAGERGERHLPELTLLEWYGAGQTYHDIMADCEHLITHLAAGLDLGPHIRFQGNPIDLTPPWPRLTVATAFRRYGSITLDQALASDRFDDVMAFEIEPQLDTRRPLFLTDYPAAHAALARLSPRHPGVAERFELYIGGMELCNAFTELTDADQQRRRFNQELAHRETAGKPPLPMPERFLEELARMPPAAGNALGIERLVMLFADTRQIDHVVAFTPESL